MDTNIQNFKSTFNNNMQAISYEDYIKVEQDSEDMYLYKHDTKEGYRFHLSNQVIINMIVELGIKGKALDIGCHTGYHTEQLKDLVGYAVGIDVNDKLLAIAQKYGRSYCQRGDMHKLEFEDNAFDLVFMHEVLEHAYDIDKVINEVYRVLKPNGFFIYSVPCAKYENSFVRLTPGDSHFSVITPIDMWNRVEKAKFRNIHGWIYNPAIEYTDRPDRREQWKQEAKTYDYDPHLRAVMQK